jgi:subtilase family serine protease
MFGPTEKDYATVVAFAKANGLEVTTTHPNRMLVDVRGTVANIQKAMHVTMHLYQHPKEARRFYAPSVEPSLDLAVPVLRISGLDNYSLPRPCLVSRPLVKGQNAVPNAGSGPSGTYMGKDFRAAYAPGVTLNGAGQVVGLVQFDGYSAIDIAFYEARAGLPSVTLSNVLIDGASGGPSGDGGEVEVSLDIEMAISMATNLTQVMVYMAPNGSPWEDILNRMANDNAAQQLSCSWYEPGKSADPTCDQIFQQMAAQGQSFFSASGDYDAFTDLIPFPDDTPYITLVGGNVEHERCGRFLGWGNGMELGQRDRERWWYQHAISDTGMAGQHRHDGQPGFDHDAERAGRGHDRRQRLCPGRWSGLQRGGHELCGAVVGRIYGIGQSTSCGQRTTSGGIHQPGHKCDWHRPQFCHHAS